jgi:hypothetical protein
MNVIKKGILFSMLLLSLIFVGLNSIHASNPGVNTIPVVVTSVFDQENPNISTTVNAVHGSTLSFSPTGRTGFRFAYWIVNGVARYDLSYETSFRVTSKLSLIAVFSPQSDHTVLFLDANGELIATRFVSNGGTVIEPDVSLKNKPGLTFASPKWKSVEGSTSLSNINTDTVFILQYEVSSEASFVMNFTEGTGSGSYAYNTIVTASVDPLQSGHFVSWTENGEVVSNQSTYKFTALKGRTLVANYSEDEPTHQTPVVYFSGNLNLRAEFQSYVGQVDVPNDYELIEYGFLIHPSSTSAALTVQTANVITAIHNKLHPVTGEFMMSFPANSHQSARAYALVLKDGIYSYIYSPQSHQPSITPVQRVTIFDGISQMTNAETFDFNHTVSPSNASSSVAWSVSDPSKATINKQGILTPVSGQTGTITVTATSLSDPTKSGSYLVTIIDSAAPVTYVSNYAQLVSAVNGTATHIKLTSNITATGQTFTPTRENFTGIFDGQGYGIVDLSINGGSNQNTGLFRSLSTNAVVKNVSFVNPTITTTQANSGLIAGQIHTNGNVTIRNVNAVNLVTNLNAAQWTHGGLVGAVFNGNNFRIFNTYVDFTFNAPSGGANLGGAVGVVNNTAIAHVAHSYFDVKVNGTSSGGIYSAILGQMNANTTGSRIDSVLGSIRNTGSTNVLSNAGLVYGQLNTAGTNHFISRVLYPSTSAYSRAFGQNNGSSQVNGTTSNANVLVTAHIKLQSQAEATEFSTRNPIWTYNTETNQTTFVLDQVQGILDNAKADSIVSQIAIPGSNAIYSDITLPTSIQSTNIVWTSSHPSIVTDQGVVTRPVGSNQVVTLSYELQVGNAVRQGDVQVTVIEAYDGVTPIVIDIIGATSVYQGKTAQLSVEITPITIEPKVTWSVVDGSQTLVSISPAGLVTGLAPGLATVRATLVSDPSQFNEFEITVIESPTVDVSLVGTGLVANEPANSQVYVNVNMPGTLYYVQNSVTQTPQQIISSGSKQTVVIENPGVTQIGVTVTNGTKLQFVYVVLDGSTVIANSTVFELTFTLLLPTVMVSNYSELVTALNRTDNINITLTQDITATGTFTSTKTNAFVGTFDGQGYKITNLSISATHSDSGLFRQISGSATFKNIVFQSPRLTTNQANSALLAGRVSSSGSMLISNVVVYDFIQTITGNQWTHGGLIGTINAANAIVTVENVYLQYKVQTTSGSVSTGNIGGIVGVQSGTSSSLIVRHSLIDMDVSFANTNNTGQIIAAVVGQINSGTITNISYVYAGIRNTGAGNAIANAGIVYSQMNNAGTNHTVTSVAVLPNSQVTKLTNNYNTSINGGNSAGHANITSQFHLTMTESVGQGFVTARSTIWSYNTETNTLSFILPE